MRSRGAEQVLAIAPAVPPAINILAHIKESAAKAKAIDYCGREPRCEIVPEASSAASRTLWGNRQAVPWNRQTKAFTFTHSCHNF